MATTTSPSTTTGGTGTPLPVRQPSGGPFRAATPTLRVAAVWAVAAAMWFTFGDVLPGGRWFAVHLWTLGALTNLILKFSEHFARTVTRADEDDRPVGAWQLPTFNLGVVLLLAGLPTGATWALAAGATIVTTVVLIAYLRLRHLRRGAVGVRFAWVARSYERAHGAFVHGAILGALLGLGVLPGAWHGAARLAHLHVMVLGWAGVTLLATLVFFGPTLARTRIEPGADDRAARALRHGATCLTVAVLLLLATGVGGPLGIAARAGAALALAGFAVAVTVVCAPVVRAALGGVHTAARPGIVALGVGFPLVAWADVVVVATGRLVLLDALGVAFALGVLLPAVVATLSHLAPMLLGRTVGARTAIGERLARGAPGRLVVTTSATIVLVVTTAFGTALGPGGAWMTRTAWVALLAATVVPMVIARTAPRG